jgi:hypothetical protein
LRLLPAAYIRAYIKRNKTDAANAYALLDAARCAEITPVRVESVEQQAPQGLASHPLVVDGDTHLAHQRARWLLARVRHRHSRKTVAWASNRSAACLLIHDRRCRCSAAAR